MAALEPLVGNELIDCAQANAKLGLETATRQCGYGDDTETFMRNLKRACEDIGVEIQGLSNLITTQQMMREGTGIEIAPETASKF